VGFCVLRHHAEWFKSLLGKVGDGVRLWNHSLYPMKNFLERQDSLKTADLSNAYAHR